MDKPWSQVSFLLPPRFLPSIFIAHRVQQSHCSSIFQRVLLTHALALHTRFSLMKVTTKTGIDVSITQLAKTSIDPIFVELTADVVRMII